MSRVVVTGATGFLGRFVCEALAAQGAEVAAGVRRPCQVAGVNEVLSLRPDSSLEALAAKIEGAETVVHLAAAVHDVRGSVTDSEYAAVNRDYTLLLARAALAVKARFVFVSSIKVNGEGTPAGGFYTESSAVNPRGGYAESKWQAERGLQALSDRSGLTCTVVRPPLVYGPGVRANFNSLMRLVQRGLPLPLASLHNARSLIYVGNLADLLARVALDTREVRAFRLYLASDGEDLSTPELVRRLARALHVTPRLFPVPVALLSAGLSALGRRAIADRLLGSLRVDSSLARAELAWAPPFSVDEGLARTADWFKASP